MNSLEGYVRQGRNRVRNWICDPRVHIFARCVGYGLAGFCLSAASLGGYCQSIAVGLVCAAGTWNAAVTALGAAVGYGLFWGAAAQQGYIWLVFAMMLTLLLSDRRICRSAPLLLPACVGLIVAVTGLAMQLVLGDDTPVGIYLLRVGLGAGSAWLFSRVLAGRNPILRWLAWGLGVLGLAQIAPTPWLSFGMVTAAILTARSAFPAAAMAGIALDLAQITPMPMTAVLTCAYLVRFLPGKQKWLGRCAPLLSYILFMYLCKIWDVYPLPALMLGGVFAGCFPGSGRVTHRRGETGGVQVRLEMAAGVLQQTGQILLEAPEVPVDEDALVQRAAERACGGCPCRRNCKDSRRIRMLPGALLHKPLLSQEELPVVCRKNGRFLAELHRSQEQLRAIHADRQRQKEYRGAVIQQYGFLSEFLQELSDRLAARSEQTEPLYTPDVRVFGNRRREENGDCFEKFSGILGKYYVLLCDGMGTGIGAVREGRQAVAMLRRLLCAGYPANHALRSLNSLCALRERAGVFTVDLLEMDLTSGRATVYKWGAVPSYVVRSASAEKIGTAGPPPGLSATELREESFRLSLRRGETLVMVSDGVGEEETLRCCRLGAGQSPGELAKMILTCAREEQQDDATVITVRLRTSNQDAS